MKWVQLNNNMIVSYKALFTAITAFNIIIFAGLMVSADSLVRFIFAAVLQEKIIMPPMQPEVIIVTAVILMLNTVVSVVPLRFYPEKNRATVVYCFLVPGFVTFVGVAIVAVVSFFSQPLT